MIQTSKRISSLCTTETHSQGIIAISTNLSNIRRLIVIQEYACNSRNTGLSALHLLPRKKATSPSSWPDICVPIRDCGECTSARSQWEGCIQSKSTWLMFIYLFSLRRWKYLGSIQCKHLEYTAYFWKGISGFMLI